MNDGPGKIYLRGQDPDDLDTAISINQFAKINQVNYLRCKHAVNSAKLKSVGIGHKGSVTYRLGDIIEAYNAYMKNKQDVETSDNVGYIVQDSSSQSLGRKRDLECRKLELELQIKLREYVSIEDIKAQLSTFIKLIQQRVLVIYPRSLPPKLQQKSSREMQAIIAEEGKAFLNELVRIAPDIIGHDTAISDGNGTNNI